MQQKKTIRIITNSSYNAHTAPLFANLNILPQDKVIIQAKLSFMHSVYYEYAPSSFTGTWQTKAQRNPELNLRNAIRTFTRYYANRTTFSIALKEFLHTTPTNAAESD
jgi:hypothetical protein